MGLPEYQQTANVWMRGIFKEEYGIEPSDIHWRTGGQEEPGRDERTPLKLGGNIDLQPIAAGKTLNKMLSMANSMRCSAHVRCPAFVNRAPNVGLMFPNYREVEMEYYKRSGMFPIMHLIGIRKTLVEQYPWLPATVYKAFCQAKKIAINEMKEMAATKVTLPWPEVSVQDAVQLMGEDFWRYGVAENARGYRNASALFVRAGAGDAKAQRGRDLPSVGFRNLKGLDGDGISSRTRRSSCDERSITHQAAGYFRKSADAVLQFRSAQCDRVASA